MNKKRKVKLVKKLYALFRKARIPKYLHHYGPKKYTSWKHLFIIFVQQRFKSGMQEALNILNDFGFTKLPDRTTLVKFVRRIPIWIWNLILKISAQIDKSELGAIDATGISRTTASDYYKERIDRINPIKDHLKLSMYFDVESRKVMAARLRAKQAHDTKDVKYLANHSSLISETNLMDKGFDDNKIHSFFRDKGVYSIIPVRKNARRGCYRKEMKNYFDYGIYFQRNAAEFIISSVKRMYGDYVRSRSIQAQRAEVYPRLILHNIKFLFYLKIFTSVCSNNFNLSGVVNLGGQCPNFLHKKYFELCFGLLEPIFLYHLSKLSTP